ncbi:PREDICTED: uncharacterized protein LOC109147021 [Ipomoea nil]|uniref:uncharacterized protein LOC109147021 n=1 Tax=Ipomoea nil TaxID=35883 RepID=UPI000900FFA8|nr:PREDICTED: uncharacterized protein LOC109147021 [Ipomoea nil]
MTTLNVRISVNKRKGDDREKGLKITRNLLITHNNKKLESKKRACSDDFNVKEIKRRRKSVGLTQDCETTMIHRGGGYWDCQNKPKTSHQGCLPNHSSSSPTATIHRSGRDRQNKPKTSHQGCLRNHRDCRSSHHSSSSPTATIVAAHLSSHHSSSSPTATIVAAQRSSHHSSSSPTATIFAAHQLSPTKELRAAMMKKRYAHLIFKAKHHLKKGDIADHLKQQEEIRRLEIAEKAKIEQEIKAA